MSRLVPIDSLSFHPLVQSLPGLMSEKSAEFAALADDIAQRGIDQPLIVTPHGICDGRNRYRGALVANVAEVPIDERPEEDAPGIILATLIHRRHYAKGALAYLAYPMLATLRGSHGGDRKSKSIESTLKTAEEIAARLGFSRDLYFQAQKVHEVFARRADLRAEFESRILSGEVGLGACVAGLASSEATTGGERRDSSPFALFQRAFKDLRVRFDQQWGKLDRSTQLAVAQDVTDAVTAMPVEVQESIVAALTGGKRRAA